MPSKLQETKYSMSYWSWALQDSYFAAAFIAVSSTGFGNLALMIGTQPDYLAWAHYVSSLLLLGMLLPIFDTINFYQI